VKNTLSQEVLKAKVVLKTCMLALPGSPFFFFSLYAPEGLKKFHTHPTLPTRSWAGNKGTTSLVDSVLQNIVGAAFVFVVCFRELQLPLSAQADSFGYHFL
jgi:hypothetical protein